MDSRSAWQQKPLSFRLTVAVVVASLVTGIGFLIQNPDFLHRVTGAGFAVGDCVRVGSAGLSGSDMKRADCSSGDVGSLGDPVYQVTQVVSGKNGYCPGGGFDHVTFSNEPEDRTYCLVMK